jgi:hypothetical protein
LKLQQNCSLSRATINKVLQKHSQPRSSRAVCHARNATDISGMSPATVCRWTLARSLRASTLTPQLMIAHVFAS